MSATIATPPARRDESISQADPRIRLARQPDFAIGPLQFVPSRRVIRADGQELVVEPRVMQVLVALFRASGAIIGRDELIAACWEGRVVGEDAINRVISRVRHLQRTIGEGVFAIETVSRVGYRLRVLAASADIGAACEPPENFSTKAHMPHVADSTRRALLQSGVALAAAAGIPTLLSLGDRTPWLGLARHRPDPIARRYYDQGMQAQYQSLIGPSESAESWFRQATEADPNWADAWGSLAMSYRHLMDGETSTAQWRLVEQAKAAARRALELDPDNAEALVALKLIPSPFGRWTEAEAEYRALLRRFPKAFVLRGHLGRLLRDVGRYSEALEVFAIIVREHPDILAPSFFLAQTLWGLGRIHEAAAAHEALIRHWPKHALAWQAYTQFLTYSGRPGAAAVYASDHEARPAGLPDFMFDCRVYEAQAIATGVDADIARARHEFRLVETRLLGTSPAPLPISQIFPFYIAVGDLDAAFALLEHYYFNRRSAASPAQPFGPLTRRGSDILFMPYAIRLRGDGRFAPLLRRLGLAAYWQRTRSRAAVLTKSA